LPMICGNTNGPRVGHGSWMLSEPNKVPLSQIIPMPAWMPYPQWPEPEPGEPARTFADVYQTEMADQQKHFDDFVEDHPNMKPMIDGRMADPGVERLREAAAFCGTKLQMKIQDDFPEIIHPVMEALAPNALRPIPAATIVSFTPKPNFTGSQIIPAGTQLDSHPVDGTKCRFTTSYPVLLQPLEITGALFAHPPGESPRITLQLQLNGIRLSAWKPSRLRFFLSGNSAEACNLYLILTRYLDKIVISPLGGEGAAATLPAECLQPVGFAPDELILPGSNASFQIVEEYFIQPDRFKFVELGGLEQWRGKNDATAFEIRFEFKALPFLPHKVTKKDFTLFATPAVNLFEHKAEPVEVTAGCLEYPVKAENGATGHYAIYTVRDGSGQPDSGMRPGVGNRLPISRRTGAAPVWELKRRIPVVGCGMETVIALRADQGIPAQGAVLDLELVCTNAELPEKIKIGDVCRTTDTSPGFATFANCTPVTRTAAVNTAANALWRLYSIYNLHLRILDAGSFRAALETILDSHCRNHAAATQHRKKIQGITDLQIRGIDRLIGGKMYRGWDIRIKLNGEHYASPGEMYLFAALLEHYLNGFASQSVITRTTVEDTQGKCSWLWPEHTGRKPLV
ncbi:MAG TPA: type VI secretion system baseplate subunit TssF, partial [Candidatus Hydrogenedentes bacterium]|nr:type VI secretion system baseplate subunit TssF [Candidatus Hydrogenedentota bacterium]